VKGVANLQAPVKKVSPASYRTSPLASNTTSSRRLNDWRLSHGDMEKQCARWDDGGVVMNRMSGVGKP
jgi:hypothetical protein